MSWLVCSNVMPVLHLLCDMSSALATHNVDTQDLTKLTDVG